MTHEEKCLSQPIEQIGQNSGDMLSRQIELQQKVADLAGTVVEDENGDVLATIKALKAMEIAPEAALKIAEGALNYGRVEVVLGRTELNKLFAGDVSVIYCEYNQREEQLHICIEGTGLRRNWQEGKLPMLVRGVLLGGSYVMMEKDNDSPRKYLVNMGKGKLAAIADGEKNERVHQKPFGLLPKA